MIARRIILTIFAVTVLTFFAPRLAAAHKGSLASPTNVGQPATIKRATQPAVNETIPSLQKREWRYTIRPSDTLQLSFMLTPEFDQTVTVQPDGYITLRDVGGLLAAGQDVPELTQSVKAAYSKILHDPVISIDLKNFEKPYFVVGGQVRNPGKFELRGNVTLTQGIAMAGGFGDGAKNSQVLLFRRVSNEWSEAKIINVKKMMKSRSLQEDPILHPGDMLFVPSSTMSKIKHFLPTSTVGAYYNPAIP